MTSPRLCVEVRPATVVTRPGRPTTGQVWLELDGTPFPEREWDDFVVALLDAVLGAVQDSRATGVPSRVSFYDGPFELSVARSGLLWSVELKSRRSSVGSLTATLPDSDMVAFEASAQTAALQVLERIDARSDDRDAAALRRRLDRYHKGS